MVDPLENLVGFYSVVGRKSYLAEGSQSFTSQGFMNTLNVRNSGITSVLGVRQSDLTRLTTSQTSKRNVCNKVTGSLQMASAGSGSESATLIKGV